MSYRTPDPQTPGPPEDLKQQLERLADAGRSRVMVLERQQQELAEQAKRIKAPTRFRRRAQESNRYLAFSGVWVLGCALVALAVAVLSGSLETGFIAFLAAAVGGAVTFVPLAIAYLIFNSFARSGDGKRLLVWSVSQPFPLHGFHETLSLNHSLSSVLVRIAFAETVPEEPTVTGLLGHLDEPSERTTVIVGAHQVALIKSVSDDEDTVPNASTKSLKDLVAKILLPLHAVHKIHSVTIGEAAVGHRFEHLDEGKELRSLLDQPPVSSRA